MRFGWDLLKAWTAMTVGSLVLWGLFNNALKHWQLWASGAVFLATLALASFAETNKASLSKGARRVCNWGAGLLLVGFFFLADTIPPG